MGKTRWTVSRKFKYSGKLLQPGDEWVPAGGKFDKLIAESPYVHLGVLVKPPIEEEVANDDKAG